MTVDPFLYEFCFSITLDYFTGFYLKLVFFLIRLYLYSVVFSCSSEMSLFAKSDLIEIRDVWSDNLEKELTTIGDIVDRFPYIAMDTEFPGIVLEPVGCNDLTFKYQHMKVNIDILKLIQIGFTFFDEQGNLPPRGIDNKYCIWQFNFREFNPAEDVYFSDSIELLRGSGIDFKTNNEKGIHVSQFSQLLTTSGAVLNNKMTWVGFHSANDFGFLVKLLSGKNMPDTQTEFFELINTYFPVIYDIKHIIRYRNDLHGGLSKLAESLGIERVGVSHQAGSDSLVTAGIFKKLKDSYFTESHSLDKYAGVLYGLEVRD
ncbi:unnamed protein product [Ilex paraguariensis]|uniref:poly(A)-specific ribonuclease n=1 Tax=Ilex paraguariensis TaxID=185542 RepID=A0ABC8SQI7_9AQUA